MGAKATKLNSCDKHPAAYSHDQDVDMCLYRCNDRNVMMNFEPGECMREVFFQSVTQRLQIENLSTGTPNRSRSYDLLITRPDALPLSYRRLVVAKAIKQFSGGVRHHQPSKPLMAYDD